MFLFLTLLLVPDPDPRRLIEQLADDDPAVRDRATRSLCELGEEALDALRDASDHPDAEVRIRASDLLRRIDQRLFLKSLAVTQRRGKIRPRPAELDSLENVASVEGAAFRFERHPWPARGAPKGWVISTRLHPFLDGEIEWRVAAVRGEKDLRVEACGDHSPSLVYVPDPAAAPCTVVLKGVRRWLCEVPVAFPDPAEGDRRRVGPFTLMIQWPHLVLECDREFSPELVTRMLDASHIRVQYEVGNEPTGPERKAEPVDEPAIFFPAEAQGIAAWCGCVDQPARSDLPLPTSRKRTVVIPGSSNTLLHHLSSLSVVFHMPMEEPFEVESPPIQ